MKISNHSKAAAPTGAIQRRWAAAFARAGVAPATPPAAGKAVSRGAAPKAPAAGAKIQARWAAAFRRAGIISK